MAFSKEIGYLSLSFTFLYMHTYKHTLKCVIGTFMGVHTHVVLLCVCCCGCLHGKCVATCVHLVYILCTWMLKCTNVPGTSGVYGYWNLPAT